MTRNQRLFLGGLRLIVFMQMGRVIELLGVGWSGLVVVGGMGGISETNRPSLSPFVPTLGKIKSIVYHLTQEFFNL